MAVPGGCTGDWLVVPSAKRRLPVSWGATVNLWQAHKGCWLEAACPSSTPRTPATSASFEVLAPSSWRPLPEAPSYFLGVYLRPAFPTHDGCQAPPLCPGPLGRCPLQFAVSWSEACGDFHCSAFPPPRCPSLLPSSLPPFSTPRPLEGNEVGTGGLSGSGLSGES